MNPDYFVKGRPYLDGLKYIIIAERGTRTAALQSGQVDVAFPGETSKTVAEQLKKAVPELVVTPYSQNVSDNIIMNTKKAPFDNPKVRLAVSHAIDRRGLIQAAHQGGAVVGASMPPKPHAFWGLGEKDLLALPGYGKADNEKAKGRKLMAEAGFTPQKPLKVEMVTRAIAIYVDMASFVINELKQIGIEATLKQIETAQWHATATRGDYQIGANLTGVGPDDPDANYFENYGCGSPRNYSQYCNEEVSKMIEAQSQELDVKKRLALVAALQKKIEQDAARPLLAWRIDYFTHRPYVKNLIPHQSIYNFGRMQEVWLDK
jgi:peptide/nickel transport system substrate-binding protein